MPSAVTLLIPEAAMSHSVLSLIASHSLHHSFGCLRFRILLLPNPRILFPVSFLVMNGRKIVVAINGKNIVVSGSVLRLPVELLMMIFIFVCFSQKCQASRFPTARERLSLVCRKWVTIVRSMPRMWQTICVDAGVHPSAVDAFVRYSAALPISVTVAHWEYGHSQASPRRVDRLRYLLSRLLFGSHRWVTVKLDTNWLPTARLMMQMLEDAALGRLESLSVSCTAFLAPGVLPVGQVYPAVTFAGDYPRLRKLRIIGFPFTLVSNPSFDRLSHLSVRCIPPTAWPSYVQFVALLAGLPLLQTLALKGVGCDPLPPGLVPAVVGTVTHLEVEFGVGPHADARGLANLLRGLEFPKLTALSLGFHALPSAHGFADSPILSRCGKVKLCGRICCEYWLGRLYTSMPDVVELDISGGAPGFLLGLSRRLTSNNLLPCPMLKVLTVLGGQWAYVRKVVESRFRSGMPLDKIRYVANVEDTDSSVERFFLDDFFYIRTHVGKLEWVP
ncbi:hypothetical protein B0H16DRAFT_1481020 [Mycena metata]|uniref:F-box domain-containing protein n=1 Tax=Mycena metata TaxID=1033252 RepID=A0AAD7MBF4_9AGAR|nr:hypothetical protein B0H16DRAFT_1481020 [Mycena metata]